MVTLIDGSVYQGILDVSDPSSASISLKQAKLVDSDGNIIKQLNILGKDVESMVASGLKRSQLVPKKGELV